MGEFEVAQANDIVSSGCGRGHEGCASADQKGTACDEFIEHAYLLEKLVIDRLVLDGLRCRRAGCAGGIGIN
jgi:hypothetical protein